MFRSCSEVSARVFFSFFLKSLIFQVTANNFTLMAVPPRSIDHQGLWRITLTCLQTALKKKEKKSRHIVLHISSAQTEHFIIIFLFCITALLTTSHLTRDNERLDWQINFPPEQLAVCIDRLDKYIKLYKLRINRTDMKCFLNVSCCASSLLLKK